MRPMRYPIFNVIAYAWVLSGTFSLQWDNEPKKDFKLIFEFTVLFQIVIRIVLIFVLYFYGL